MLAAQAYHGRPARCQTCSLDVPRATSGLRFVYTRGPKRDLAMALWMQLKGDGPGEVNETQPAPGPSLLIDLELRLGALG